MTSLEPPGPADGKLEPTHPCSFSRVTSTPGAKVRLDVIVPHDCLSADGCSTTSPPHCVHVCVCVCVCVCARACTRKSLRIKLAFSLSSLNDNKHYYLLSNFLF